MKAADRTSPWRQADGQWPLPWLPAWWAAAARQRGHALLLQGPRGIGEFELALTLAQGWLCEAGPAPAAEPCGHCEACHLLQRGVHPDFMLLVPEAWRDRLGLTLEAADDSPDAAAGKSAATRGAAAGREIRVAEVRRAIDWAHQTASRGRAKVLVIYPAEQLNLISANALLKTLEEPPGRLRLVMVTGEPQSLMPTLRSRCQHVSLEPPPTQESRAWLEGQGLEGADVLLQAAGGRPQDALALARDGLTARDWLQWPQALKQGRAEVWAGLPIGRVLEGLQKLCLDLMNRAHGVPTTYFPAEALPTGAQANSLAHWWTRLQRVARHADHPWNAALLVETLVLEGRQCWPPRAPAPSPPRQRSSIE